MFIGILCVVAAVIAAIYLLIPIPLLTYRQSKPGIQHGEVTAVKKIRPGVFEVSLRQGMEIDSRLQQSNEMLTEASCTRFFHFRQWHPMPKIGDRISVSSVNRRHLFTGSSFNWVKSWEPAAGEIPAGGKIELAIV